jgi:regulator of CtrA degradation
MTRPATLNARILEGLYCEALVLAEEVRAAFSLSGRIERAGQDEDLARVALSCVGLRTTTRMMHAIAWLLNHRAYLKGELSEFQLRRYGALACDERGTDSTNFALLDEEVRELVEATEQFYARLLRLDHAWRQREPSVPPGALQRLRQRFGSPASR